MSIIERYFTKNKHIKKVGILVVIALIIFIITYILWELLFSNYYIFKEQETKFLEAVKKYYSYKENLLPKKGEIREVKLEKMFLENRIESLNAPKSDTLCDTDSWAKVYHDENDEYIYYTYLKCGKYESKIDHTGPVITLNGDNNIIINQGQPYQELGVKSVVDDKDGKIDIKKVEIDSSKVDTSKTGTYKVTYKIRDSLNNQTKITRKVTVARNLTEVVKSATDESNYYKGPVNNNYILFSGMMWRIINVNNDGSIRLIIEDITNNLRYTEDKYKDSNVDKWLTNVFLPSIESSDYLVDSEYCVGSVASAQDTSNACSEKITSKVGLLSIDEYNKTLLDGFSSISYRNNLSYMYANKINNDNTYYNEFRQIATSSTVNLLPIKPVIVIKSNMYISSGDGTFEAPYKLEDYTYGKEHDKINSRLIGEYIKYSDMTFRIIEKNKAGNVKIIMAEPFMNSTYQTPLIVSLENIDNYKFNVTDENNPGYIINNQYIDYIDESNLITTNHKIITNDPLKTYDNFETTTMKAKLVIAQTTDLFSGLNSALKNNVKRIQLFADRTTSKGTFIMLNVVTGRAFEFDTGTYDRFAFKVVTYINGNSEIKTGNGTVNSPYIIK